MNWEEVGGKWDQIKGKVKEQWGKLTDDDLMAIKGKRDRFIGKIRERYGYAKDHAEKELDKFISKCNCDKTNSSNYHQH